jgi:pantothenate kinase
MVTVDVDDLATWIADRAAGASRFLLGIAGPPGSGKSTLAGALAAHLGAPVVPMDGFHLPNAVLAERGSRARKGAPDTFAAEAFVDLVRWLRSATVVVTCPTFDRMLDEAVPDQVRVRPEDTLVIVEGNYLLLDDAPWSELAELFDAIAYLDVPTDLRVERLVERHVAFGRSRSEALAFVHRSDEANTRRVQECRHRADIVVPMR